MRQTFPFFIAILGLALLGATMWLLFIEGEEGPAPDDPSDLESAEEIEQPPTVINRFDDQVEREKITQSDEEGETAPADREMLLPEMTPAPYKGHLKIHLASREEKIPLSEEDVARLRVSYNGISLGRAPAYIQPGLFELEALLPGRYRVEAVTKDWRIGSASVGLQPGELGEIWVQVSEPSHLQIQVVDEDAGSPVAKAKVEARGFIDGGITDDQGLFKSARKLHPDTELGVEISHPDYFNTCLDPCHPEVCGASRIGKGSSLRVPLKPLSGNLTLSGRVEDENGVPLARWGLFLTLKNPGKGKASYLPAFTDREGAFAFRKLPPGTYSLKGTLGLLMTLDGTEPPPVFEEEYRLLPGGSMEDQVIVCRRARRPFSGRAFLSDSHAPAAGYRISFVTGIRGFPDSANDPLFFEPVTVDGSGSFHTKESFLPEEIFRMVLNGSVRITSPLGKEMTYRPVQNSADLRRLQASIVRGEPLTLWVAAASGFTLSGRILDASGAPLPHVRLNAEIATGSYQGRQTGHADANGLFRIPNLYPGEWIVSAVIPSGPVLEQRVVIPITGEVPELVFRLKDACTLTGRLVSDKIPKRITLRVEGLDFTAECRLAGSSFEYAFQHLPSGKARLVLEVYQGNRFQEGYLVVQEAWADLKPGQVVQQDFTF